MKTTLVLMFASIRTSAKLAAVLEQPKMPPTPRLKPPTPPPGQPPQLETPQSFPRNGSGTIGGGARGGRSAAADRGKPSDRGKVAAPPRGKGGNKKQALDLEEYEDAFEKLRTGKPPPAPRRSARNGSASGGKGDPVILD